MVDLQWNLISDASQNFGNALTNAAGQVRQHRETDRNRTAVRNYLANPDDKVAFSGLAERSPELAFRIQDQHIERARQLRGDQQQQLDTLGQILSGPNGQPIPAEQYPVALQLAQRAGIDTTGHETYDPAFVGAIVQLHSRLHPVTPVSVAQGARLLNPVTGTEVGRGAPARPHYLVIPPGGRAELEPSYDDQQPTAPPAEAPAFATPNPAPGVDEPALRAQAEAAIRAGRNPELVWQRYQQLLTEGGAAPQGGQTFP